MSLVDCGSGDALPPTPTRTPRSTVRLRRRREILRARTVTPMAEARLLDGLRHEIDDLDGFDPTALPEAQLLAVTIELDRELQRLTAQHARFAAAVDASQAWAGDGSRSAAARLGRECRRPRGACARAIRLGRVLRHLPLTDAALSNGAIGIEHADELARCRQTRADAFDADEAMLVGFAQTLRFDDFQKACAYWRPVVDPAGSEREADRLHDARFLRWHTRADGSVAGEFQLDRVGGAALVEALKRIERELLERDWSDAKEEHGPNLSLSNLERTPRQRRADALVEVAHRGHTAPVDGKRPDPLVTVYVDYETFVGRLCELADSTVIAPGETLPLLSRAELERVVFAPGKRVIELSERARCFTGGLRRAIQLRDRRCQWPGCDVPAIRCHVDHTLADAGGGPTKQANGRCLCGWHNQYAERERRRQRRRPAPARIAAG